ncbi:MAG: amino acid racemase [Proteobacteria bacterium]|nr:amino acid racemase [Pseudomonadota bacterium]
MVNKTRFGIVGGLGPLAGADLFQKLLKATPARSDRDHYYIIIEQHPFDDSLAPDGSFEPRRHKFYVYNTIKHFESRSVDVVLLGCFLSHSFLAEIEPELQPRIISIFEALSQHLRSVFPHVRRLGVLTSSYARRVDLFEKNLPGYQLIYPDDISQNNDLSEAIYGPEGIKAGNLGGEVVEMICRACLSLIAQGAECIVPGFTEIPLILDAIRNTINRPIIDCNQVYAEYAVSCQTSRTIRSGKLGIVGGVGPAATVDFMEKIIRQTKVGRDQDHIRMIVEHNPQIPDRTANLLRGDTDPTIPLFSACRKLEQAGADAIAIPCNTAHAFFDRIQPHLSIPILNMLELTACHIARQHPGRKNIGLLATTGTVQSGIYRDVLERAGLRCLVPAEGFQELVMAVIYGPKGVKADFDYNLCRQNLSLVVNYLQEIGAEALILGCTELPLVLSATDTTAGDTASLPIFDPTEILAARCVELFQTGRSL